MEKCSANFYIETIHGDYVGYNDPIFFDTRLFGWVAKLESIFPSLLDELDPILVDDAFLITNPETHIQLQKKGWKLLPLYFSGIKFKKNLLRFPLLYQSLSEIPHLITASISVLEPGARLLPHNGSTNAIMRAHLPLKVPGKYPACGMLIEGHEISWIEGKIFMFCDMKVHHVQNLTDRRRYILLIDVIRPEFVHLKKKICVHTMARILTNWLLNIGRSLMKMI